MPRRGSTTPPARETVFDREGHPFGELDFGTADHIEVILGGREVVRIARSHFESRGEGRPLRLNVPSDDVFRGKHATTIDGIDLGEVVAVVRGGGGRIEALLVASGGEGEGLAIPLAFVREVSAHLILEPSAEEVEAAQAAARASPGVREALRKSAKKR